MEVNQKDIENKKKHIEVYRNQPDSLGKVTEEEKTATEEEKTAAEEEKTATEE